MSALPSGTWRVLQAEWYRARHSRVLAGSALGLALVSALRVGAAHLADLSTYAANVQRALGQGREPPPLPGPLNAWAPFADGWLAGLTVGTLLLLITSARALAGDRESGLLRVARTRSASRAGLVLGRALLGLAFVTGLLLATGLGSLAAAALWYDFGPIVEGNFEIFSTSELHGELLRAVLVTLPPLLATWCFGLCVSAFVRGATGAVAAALTLYLGFDLFKEVLGPRQYFVFAAFNPSFVDKSCLHEFAGIARGFSDAGYTEALYAQNQLLPWPWIAGLVVAACLVMRRRAL